MHVLRPRCAKHESLPVRANLRYDLAYLRLETHVKHTIRLVQDKVGDATEVGLRGLKHVDQPTRSGDHDLDTALEVTDLGTLGRTTVDGSVSDARVGAELCAFLLDLYGKFTSRGEDESSGIGLAAATIARSSVSRGSARTVGEGSRKDGEEETTSFPRTRLRAQSVYCSTWGTGMLCLPEHKPSGLCLQQR